MRTVIESRGTEAPWDYVSVNWYLSADTNITTSDYFVGGLEEYFGGPSTKTIQDSTYEFFSIPPGTYYLGAIIDPENVRRETDESNNTLVGHQVEVRSLADLVLLSCTAPTTAVGGQSIPITAVVTNAGADFAFSQLGIYLSIDPLITTNDLFLGASPVMVLDHAGNPGQATVFSVPIPNSVPPGNYYIGGIADYASGWAETNELNNSLPGTPITISIQTDFALTQLTAPPTATIGGILYAPITVTNLLNTGLTEPFHLGFFVSTNPVVTTNDLLLREDRLQPSAPWSLWSAIQDNSGIPIPASLPPGNYYLTAILDWRHRIAETTKTNNQLTAGPIQIRLAFDVAAVSIGSDTIAGPGGFIWITNAIANLGLESPSYTAVDFYLSTDPVITTADYRLGGDPYGAPLGQQRTYASFRPLPWSIPPGNYYIGFIIDPQNNIPELDESNNAVAGNLVQVRDPLPVTLTDVRRSGPNVLVRFPTVPGCAYTLQRTTSLRPPIAWKTLPLAQYLRATGDSMTFTDTALPGTGQQFYQLILER